MKFHHRGDANSCTRGFGRGGDRRGSSAARLALFLSLALFSPTAGAELQSVDLYSPGDGLVTRDTLSGLDWLDLTETVNLSYDDVEAGAGGWTAAGWRHATTAEVCDLIQKTGIAMSCPGFVSGSPADTVSTHQLLLGVTDSGSGTDSNFGLFDDTSVATTDQGIASVLRDTLLDSFAVQVSPDSADPTTSDATLGHYLVRTSPPPSPCGDGTLQAGEVCDDGNTADGDCCSADCQTAAASGTACEDGDACTGPDACDGSGGCVGGPALDCDDGDACTADSCDSVAGCAHTPIDGCLTASAGRILVGDGGAIFAVDPASGDRWVIASATIGTGTAIETAVDLAVEPAGTVLVADFALPGIHRLDPTSGDRTVVSGCVDSACTAIAGSGMDFSTPGGIALTEAGTILVGDSTLMTLFEVDPVTGDRSVVSGCEDAGCTSERGTGDAIPFGDVVASSSGYYYATYYSNSAVYQIDPSSGNRSLLSGNGAGSGPTLYRPNGIARDADGSLLVTELGGPDGSRIIRIDPVTGARAIVTDNVGVGSGPSLELNPRLAVDRSGGILVADTTDLRNALIRVDSATGDRVIVSDASTGAGSLWYRPTTVAVIPPDPPAAGDLVVSDLASDALFRVDPVSGDRRLISSNGIGLGPILENPRGLVLGSDGRLFVAHQTSILAVDLVTGNRQAISSSYWGVGSGPPMQYPIGIAQQPDGDLVVATDFGESPLLRIDPATGDRTVLSTPARVGECYGVDQPFGCCTGVSSGDGTPPCVEVGTGPAFTASLRGVAIEADGQILVADENPGGGGAVFRVDPVTGDRAVLSSCDDASCPVPAGSGTAFAAPVALALESSQDVVVSDLSAGRIVRVDRDTGDRSNVYGLADEPTGIVVDASGGIVFGNQLAGTILRIPSGGPVEVVTGGVSGSGPALLEPQGIVLMPSCGNGLIEVGETCDDGNTADGDCCSSSCQLDPEFTACEDGDLCTTGDTCTGGVCVGGPPPVCDDGNVCTDDVCDSVSGCLYPNNTAPCDDADACTDPDTCAAGTCVGGPPTVCDDSNACTDDSCNPATGCVFTDNADPCDDSFFCNGADSCGGGSCSVHAGNPCPGPDGDADCAESCDEGAGDCSAPDPDLAACDDADACTAGDRCTAGVCVASGAIDCEDLDDCTADSCDSLSGCANDPIGGCTGPVEPLPGDLLVVDRGIDVLFSVDPASGDRRIQSSPSVGSGSPFANPSNIARERDGSAIVVDVVGASGKVWRVDPSTGDRTVVSSDSVGSGPPFSSVGTAYDVAVERDGDLLVSVVSFVNPSAIFRVDPATGDRTVVTSASVGSGPTPGFITSLALELDGDIAVAELTAPALLRVDPATGDRTVVSSASRGAGPLFIEPGDIAVERDGSVIAVDATSDAVFRIDPVTGDRTVLSSNSVAGGPSFSVPLGVAVRSDGSIWVVDDDLPAVFRIDPVTGDRTIVSDAGTGGGTPFDQPEHIAAVPPEPLPFEATLSIDLPGLLPFGPITAYGTGVAVVNDGFDGAPLLSDFSLRGGTFATTGSAFTGTASGGISNVLLSFSNAPGVFSGTGGGGFGGTMGVRGLLRMCVLSGCAATIPLPLTLNGTRGVGLGGSPIVTTGTFGLGSLHVAGLSAGSWTTGSASAGPGLAFASGFAHGPASGTTRASVAQASGQIQLIAPIVVATSVSPQPVPFAGFATLTLHFVPEPGGLWMLGAGVACLALAGWRRKSL